MIEAFGGFVRCGNCNYKFNVHDQVQVERDYFELSSADELDEEAPVRLHAMGGIDDDEIAAPPSGRIEPALEVKDDGLNIRFNADEFGQHTPAVDTPAIPKVEPRFEASIEDDQPAENSAPDLRIEADLELETGGENVVFTAGDDSKDLAASVSNRMRAEPEADDFAFSQGFSEAYAPNDKPESSPVNVAADHAPTGLDTGAEAEDSVVAVPGPDRSVTELRMEEPVTAVVSTDQTVVVEDENSEPDTTAPDELDRLLGISDHDENTLEVPAIEVTGESGSADAGDDAARGSQQEDFSWGLDSMDELQDSKPRHVFNDDKIESEDQAQSESDLLDAFTFSREFEEPTPDVESRGEVHTLLNTEGEASPPDAPGFARRFAAGLGQFMVFWFWLLLSIGLVYLLIGQIKDQVYPQIKSEPVVQDIRNRVCGFLPCKVSKYDAEKYEIVVSRMDEVRDPNRQLHLSVFLLNKAEQAQVYPSLRITFKRLDGSTVGQRVVGPDEYSTSSNRVVMAGDGAGGVTKPLIQPGKLGKVLIRFNNPPADAVGFEAQVAP